MSKISKRKLKRLEKKVRVHIIQANSYFLNNDAERCEIEIQTAYKNLRKEKIYPDFIMREFAAIYNNLGSLYYKRDDLIRSFTYISKSLNIKIDIEDEINSIKGTFQNVVNCGLYCCEFDYLIEKISILNRILRSDDEFIKYMESINDTIRKIQNNEPQIYMKGLTFIGKEQYETIGDFVYFPNYFKDINSQLKYNITLDDHSTLICNIYFDTDTAEQVDEPYKDDGWKIFSPPDLAPRISGSTPNLLIFLTPWLHIPGNSVEIKDNEGNSIDFKLEKTFSEYHIPDSYPKFGYSFGQDSNKIPKCKSFKFFRGLTCILHWKLLFGQKYSIVLKIKNLIINNNFSFRSKLGFLIPFKSVKHYNCNLIYKDIYEVIDIKQKYVKYFENKDNPSAILFTPEPDSLSDMQLNEYNVPIKDPKYNKYVIHREENLEDFHVDIISFNYKLKDNSISISTYQWEQPIPVVFSNYMIDGKYGFPSLCTYSISNNTETEVNANITTIIDGYTFKYEEMKTIMPKSNELIKHNPIFDNDKLSNETKDTTLNMKVSINGNIIYNQMEKVRLLAKDTMVWEILNPITKKFFYLHDFCVTLVTPHDDEVEKILSIAKEYHPNKVLQGYPSIADNEQVKSEVDKQVESIFIALKNIGISYIDSSISFGWHEPFKSQRIRFPSTSIKYKSANCIDGTILFASILENIGLEPIIILVPGHALVGWKKLPNSEEISILETTVISNQDYQSAKDIAEISLMRGLKKVNKIMNRTMNLEEAIKSGHIKFIDVRKMREKGVFPSQIS